MILSSMTTLHPMLSGLSLVKCSLSLSITRRSLQTHHGAVEAAYRTLGLDSKASRQQVKEAFYNLSKELHPDVSKTQSTEKFQELNEAYKLLCSLQVDYQKGQVKSHNVKRQSRNPPSDIDDWIRNIHKNNKNKTNYEFRDEINDLDNWVRFNRKREFMENARRRKLHQRQKGTHGEDSDIDDLKYESIFGNKHGVKSEHYQNYEKQFIKTVFRPLKKTENENVVTKNWFYDVCIRWMLIHKMKSVFFILMVNLGLGIHLYYDR